MDVTDISPHLDQLDGDLDKLEDALQPLLQDLGEVASKLPLLDKAKLYVLATYSIESTLYCKKRRVSPVALKYILSRGQLTRSCTTQPPCA